MRKSTLEKILHRLSELDNGVEFISKDYERGGTHCHFKCSCGNIWSASHTKVCKGSKCSKCSRSSRRITTELANDRLASRGLELVKRHSNIEFATFKCSTGHTWDARFSSVYNNQTGCPHCSQRAMKTYEEVVDALNDRKITLISNEYLGVKKQHDLQCQVCGHNWRITLGGAIKGTGCPKCSNRLKIGIEQAVVVAKERGFEVLSEDYIEGTTNSFMVKCDNGHIFRTNRHNFVNGGKGCAKCANNLPLSLDEKNTKLEKNGWRLLEDVPSVNAIGKLECTKCGGKKEANVSRYMKTYVLCRRCEPCDWERGFSPKLPAILYYLRISNGDQILYKLGITNRTVKDRFKKSELDNIEVLRELKFETGQQAHELEQYYLNLFSEYRYKGDPILKSGGNTEILTTDILGLDTLNQKPL